MNHQNNTCSDQLSSSYSNPLRKLIQLEIYPINDLKFTVFIAENLFSSFEKSKNVLLLNGELRNILSKCGFFLNYANNSNTIKWRRNINSQTNKCVNLSMCLMSSQFVTEGKIEVSSSGICDQFDSIYVYTGYDCFNLSFRRSSVELRSFW